MKCAHKRTWCFVFLFFRKSRINYVAVSLFRVAGAAATRKGREPRTCRRGFVSLRGPAGTTPPHGVEGGHAEAVVHVAVQLGHGLVVVAGHAEQLLPGPRLPLALLVLDDELC